MNKQNNIAYRKIELWEDQRGFRKKCTQEVILALGIVKEGKLKNNKDTAFVGLEKTFDNVNWNKMFKRLKKLGLKFKERMPQNLYKDQVVKRRTRKDKHQ